MRFFLTPAKFVKMTAHEKAAQKAIAALPNENPNEIRACINPDGTVDTYTFPFVPEWLATSSKKLRDKIYDVLFVVPA